MSQWWIAEVLIFLPYVTSLHEEDSFATDRNNLHLMSFIQDRIYDTGSTFWFDSLVWV